MGVFITSGLCSVFWVFFYKYLLRNSSFHFRAWRVTVPMGSTDENNKSKAALTFRVALYRGVKEEANIHLIKCLICWNYISSASSRLHKSASLWKYVPLRFQCVARIDPQCFLTGCRKMRQTSVLQFYILFKRVYYIIHYSFNVYMYLASRALNWIYENSGT